MEAQCYADDCLLTTTCPELLRLATRECERFSSLTGMGIAPQKCKMFVNDFADAARLHGITTQDAPLEVASSADCLGVELTTGRRSAGAKQKERVEKALAKTTKIPMLPIHRQLRARVAQAQGYVAGTWSYGIEHSLDAGKIAKRVRPATLRAIGYGNHLRCTEIVHTLFIMGHLLGPMQASAYRLISGFLNVLQRGGPKWIAHVGYLVAHTAWAVTAQPPTPGKPYPHYS